MEKQSVAGKRSGTMKIKSLFYYDSRRAKKKLQPKQNTIDSTLPVHRDLLDPFSNKKVV
jgi:hypothetical protein